MKFLSVTVITSQEKERKEALNPSHIISMRPTLEERGETKLTLTSGDIYVTEEFSYLITALSEL